MALSLDQLAITPEVPGMSRVGLVPLRIQENGLLSDTSVAGECFVNQRFSQKLQTFMIGYVSTILSDRSIYESL